MEARAVKQGLQILSQTLPVRLPTTAWSFSTKRPAGAIGPEKDTWTCMFGHMNEIAGGKDTFGR